jgi:serine/threonine-protein kinase
MEAAHRLGIVHRDLKLDNVMVLDEPPGRDLVKILDFGLAKQVGDMRGTAAGFVVGTPRYIAPEVSTSGVATPPADMYAVGMMLTELAIGGPLWGGDSLGELLSKKLDPQPAIAQVPEALRAVTRALLDVSPERRPDAAQARDLLARIGRGEHIAVVSVPGEPGDGAPTARDRPVAVPRRTKRRWVIAGAIGGAAVASIVAVVATRAHDRKHPPVAAGSAAVRLPPDARGPEVMDPWAGSAEVAPDRREK